ncbi:MAG: OmpA family protein [Pseudomonadota bacterium]
MMQKRMTWALLSAGALALTAPGVMAQDVSDIVEGLDASAREYEEFQESQESGSGDALDDFFGESVQSACAQEDRECRDLNLDLISDGGDFVPTTKVSLAVRFLYDSAQVADDSVPVLARLCTAVQERPDFDVTLEAHTDAKGTKAYNMNLSSRRADALRTYLVGTCDVAESRIRIRPLGEEQLDRNYGDYAPEQRRVLVYAQPRGA